MKKNIIYRIKYKRERYQLNLFFKSNLVEYIAYKTNNMGKLPFTTNS